MKPTFSVSRGPKVGKPKNPIWIVCVCVVAVFSVCDVPAQSVPGRAEVETAWPGVRFEIFRVERIPSNRLVVAVRVLATEKAPPTGTFLGTGTPIPSTAKHGTL